MLKTFAKLVGLKTASKIQPNSYEIVCGDLCSYGSTVRITEYCYSTGTCSAQGCDCY